MAQFDVHALKASHDRLAFVVELQHPFHDALITRLVAPLAHVGRFPIISDKLNPRFVIDGQTVILAIQEIGTIRRSDLGSVIGNLEAERHRILAAFDYLMTGV